MDVDATGATGADDATPSSTHVDSTAAFNGAGDAFQPTSSDGTAASTAIGDATSSPTLGDTGSSSSPLGTQEILLWTGAAPGSESVTFVEAVTDRSTEGGVADRAITKVSKPSLMPFPASKANGAAAIILPGGGYQRLAIDKEGTDIALWLASIGITAFVLKYRLPIDYPGSPWIPLADAQRAIRTVRKNAGAWSLDSARIGIVGFSAGGHLASQLETRFAAQTTTPRDVIDALDARPSFGILMYPVISMDPAVAHAGSRTALLGNNPTPALVNLYSSELQVTANTPGTFIGVSSKDTTVNPQNSVRFDNALKAAGVLEEFHLYVDGAHGVGIRAATGDMAAWPGQCAAWLKTMKIVP